MEGSEILRCAQDDPVILYRRHPEEASVALLAKDLIVSTNLTKEETTPKPGQQFR